MFKKKSNFNETEKTLKNCPLFQNLDKSEVKSILSIVHTRDYAVDERIFSEGTVGLCFYLIMKGAVNIITSSGSDNKILKTLEEGAYFSEVHLFSEATHSVSCVAKELTTMLVISKPDLEDIIKLKPKLGNTILLNFLEFISIKLDETYKENIKLKLSAGTKN